MKTLGERGARRREQLGFWLDTILVFLVHPLNMSSHCLAASIIPDEIYPKTFIKVPFCVTSYFPLPAFEILSLSLALESLILLCLGVDLFQFILIEIL